MTEGRGDSFSKKVGKSVPLCGWCDISKKNTKHVAPTFSFRCVEEGGRRGSRTDPIMALAERRPGSERNGSRRRQGFVRDTDGHRFVSEGVGFSAERTQGHTLRLGSQNEGSLGAIRSRACGGGPGRGLSCQVLSRAFALRLWRFISRQVANHAHTDTMPPGPGSLALEVNPSPPPFWDPVLPLRTLRTGCSTSCHLKKKFSIQNNTPGGGVLPVHRPASPFPCLRR